MCVNISLFLLLLLLVVVLPPYPRVEKQGERENGIKNKKGERKCTGTCTDALLQVSSRQSRSRARAVPGG